MEPCGTPSTIEYVLEINLSSLIKLIQYKESVILRKLCKIIYQQPDLPKLPVPELDKTMERYLQAIQPILTTTQFENVKNLAKSFEEIDGPELQHELYERRMKMKNWAYDWWLNDMYLNNPLCLPINSNPGGVFPSQTFHSVDDQLQFAAKLTTFFLDFKDKLDKNLIPVEKAASREPGQPLCMAQYYRLMSTYRVPGLPRDYQRNTSATLIDHIIVAYKKHFFSCPIRTVERRLTAKEIVDQFKLIVDSETTDNDTPVGLLTSQRRPTWADERTKLLAEEINKQSLEEIETCYFIVCLDEPLPLKFNSTLSFRSKNAIRIESNGRDETNMMHQMLHGGGSNFNTGNRWFDKTLQFIVSSDGANGICYEHSPAEAVGLISLIDEFFKSIGNSNNEINEEVKPLQKSVAPPLRLEWVISNDASKAIVEAGSTIDRAIADLEYNIFRYEEYGKEFIKKQRVSPDVYIQLALQLAYFSLHGKMVATYESGSTRRFKLGRVDCIRSTTIEALEWVKAMRPGVRTDDKTDQLRKFHAAVDKQTLVMTENILGEGIDIHLLGLKQQATEMGKDIPQIFLHETFNIANNFELSTSQLSTQTNQLMGYGPVVPDGYGISYNLRPESIIYCAASFRSSSITSTVKYINSLQQSLGAMKQLLE